MPDQFDIKLEDIPEEFREIAEAIGLEAFLKLVEWHGGDGLYLPHLKTLKRASRNRAICARFNGYNHRELARQNDLTVRTVRRIVSAGAGTLAKRDPRQLGIPGF